MSKLNPSISGIVCFLWIAVWSWWLSRENASLTTSAGAISHPSLALAAPDTLFTSNDIFSFHKSDATPVIPEGNIQFLRALANYLAKHTEQSLTLVGSYLPLPYERNKSPHPNLGVARANAIKDLLVAEGADRYRIQASGQEVESIAIVEDRISGGVDFIFGEMEKEMVENQGESVPEKSSTASISDLKDNDIERIIIFTYDDEEFSLAKKNRPELDELRHFIRKNPSYTLIISGYSAKDEEKAVRNLAERRSLAVRRYLVDTGVRRRNIIVESYPGAAKDASQQKVEISIVK